MSDRATEDKANSDNRSECYIKIARACLKAINQSGSASEPQEAKVQRVYDAIDEAFQAEFLDYRESLAVMTSVMERIASGTLDSESAAQLAQKTLNQTSADSANHPLH